MAMINKRIVKYIYIEMTRLDHLPVLLIVIRVIATSTDLTQLAPPNVEMFNFVMNILEFWKVLKWFNYQELA